MISFGPSTIPDIQRLTSQYTLAVEKMRPQSLMGRLVKRLIVRSHRHAVMITHVDTSALKNSHLMELDLKAKEAFGRISISKRTRNPVHGERPSVYGIEEHDRGGSHAFYERTFNEKTIPDGKQVLIDLGKGFDVSFKGG